MWIKYPVVAAKIEKVAVSNLLMVPNLNFCELRPINHTRFEVKIIVDGVVMEFFQLDPLLLRYKVLVYPV
jgi:hypothetical protein